MKSLSCVQLLVTPWTAAYQDPPSMGFYRHEYWSGLPLPSPHTESFTSLNIPFRKVGGPFKTGHLSVNILAQRPAFSRHSQTSGRPFLMGMSPPRFWTHPGPTLSAGLLCPLPGPCQQEKATQKGILTAQMPPGSGRCDSSHERAAYVGC